MCPLFLVIIVIFGITGQGILWIADSLAEKYVTKPIVVLTKAKSRPDPLTLPSTMLATLTANQIIEMLITDTVNRLQAKFPYEFTPLELEEYTLDILKRIERSIGNKLKDDVLCSGNTVNGFEISTQSKMTN